MDELEWLTSTDARRMLEFCRPDSQPERSLISDRKLHLFTLAVFRSARPHDPSHEKVANGWEEKGVVEGQETRLPFWINGEIWRHTTPPADLMRDIVGNPFRECLTHKDLATHGILAWQGGIIPRLAQQVYDSRDFSGMAILADALEDAGCEDEAILAHCRQPKYQCKYCLKPVNHWYSYAHKKDWFACSHCGVSLPCHKYTMLAIHARGCWVVDLILGKE
jgi:hypothetical protein